METEFVSRSMIPVLARGKVPLCKVVEWMGLSTYKKLQLGREGETLHKCEHLGKKSETFGLYRRC